MCVGGAVRLALFVDLAEFALAFPCNFEEVLRELDRFRLGVGFEDGESTDDLFRFGEGAVGDLDVSS